VGIVLAWLVGEGIITYRWMKAGAPPTPGTLAAASGFFVLCALLGEYPPARTTATLLAVGVDVAALLQVLGKAPATQATGWPPPMISDPNVLLPNGAAAASGSKPAAGGASSGSSGSAPAAGKSWNFWTGYL
jgi:hypothetical protein